MAGRYTEKIKTQNSKRKSQKYGVPHSGTFFVLNSLLSSEAREIKACFHFPACRQAGERAMTSKRRMPLYFS